jgi:hypothetical protein
MGNRAAVERCNISTSDNDGANPIHFALPFFTQRISVNIAPQPKNPLSGEGGFDENRVTALKSQNRFSFKNGFSKIVQETAASKQLKTNVISTKGILYYGLRLPGRVNTAEDSERLLPF